MALPTILVNSATGSDTQASGAGPGTALFGTTGVTDAGGTNVDLSADAPDLSGVATDGSAVLFMSDTNAGSRNFGKITAVDNGTKIVTVSDAFQGSNTDAWAIGGKRASIAGTTSKKLFENNSAAGDAMPGWTIEMESGHSETVAAAITFRRAGDTTTGPIRLLGTSGAGTLPLLTFSNNGNALVANGDFLQLRDFELRNSNATKTASVALVLGTSSWRNVRGIKVSHSTDKFWKGCTGALMIEECEIGYCANNGVSFNAQATILNCWVHHCGAIGIVTGGGSVIQDVLFCLINNNTGDGISLGTSSVSNAEPQLILGNTIDSNGGDGIEVTTTTARPMNNCRILNNILSNNSGYGINFSGTPSDALLAAYATRLLNNDFYNNTSGKYFPTTITISENEQTGDPTFTNTGGNDYSIGTNLKAKGYPLGGTLYVGKTSATYSYVDIGAAQRQEPSGSGGNFVAAPTNAIAA